MSPSTHRHEWWDSLPVLAVFLFGVAIFSIFKYLTKRPDVSDVSSWPPFFQRSPWGQPIPGALSLVLSMPFCRDFPDIVAQKTVLWYGSLNLQSDPLNLTKGMAWTEYQGSVSHRNKIGDTQKIIRFIQAEQISISFWYRDFLKFIDTGKILTLGFQLTTVRMVWRYLSFDNPCFEPQIWNTDL